MQCLRSLWRHFRSSFLGRPANIEQSQNSHYSLWQRPCNNSEESIYPLHPTKYGFLTANIYVRGPYGNLISFYLDSLQFGSCMYSKG